MTRNSFPFFHHNIYKLTEKAEGWIGNNEVVLRIVDALEGDSLPGPGIVAAHGDGAQAVVFGMRHEEFGKVAADEA